VLVTSTIIALFTIIGIVVCSTLVSILDSYIVLVAKACSSKYFAYGTILHTMVVLVQLHHFLGLLFTHHGVDSIKVKQITK
jgi:hypothetical protein